MNYQRVPWLLAVLVCAAAACLPQTGGQQAQTAAEELPGTWVISSR